MHQKNKWIGIVLLTFLTSFLLIACKANSSTTKEADSDTSTTKTIKVIAGNGDISVPTNPKKVVVFDLGVADTIRALGYEDSIVGMPTSNLPEYLSAFTKKVENVGNMKEPDIEAIQKLEPDIIIASGRTADYIDKFQEIAPTILFEKDNTDYWNSVTSNIKTLASIYGDKAVTEAETRLAELDQQIDAIAKSNSQSDKKTLSLMLNEGSMSVFGANSSFAFLYNTLGFQTTDASIKDSRHGQAISFEGVSEINPDKIFVVNRTLAVGGDNSSNETLLANELIQSTKAAKNSEIITLTSDLWYLSGGGLESTQIMIEDVKEYAN